MLLLCLLLGLVSQQAFALIQNNLACTATGTTGIIQLADPIFEQVRGREVLLVDDSSVALAQLRKRSCTQRPHRYDADRRQSGEYR